MKKFLNSDWLRAVQFFRTTVPKNEIYVQVQISLTITVVQRSNINSAANIACKFKSYYQNLS
jgi:hypothetical protein